MKIHEYQAQALFAAYGIPVLKGIMAEDVEKARDASEEIGFPCVVKAQIHAGGRGKAGGVKIVHTTEEVCQAAEGMLGKKLVTHQTGPEGKTVHKLLISETAKVKKEYYLSLTIDYKSGMYVFVASGAGGTEIEETARFFPEKVIKKYFSVLGGLKRYQVLEIAEKIGIPEEQENAFVQTAFGMFRLFNEKDCTLVEINPLVITEEEKLLALDAKINFDDSALKKHPDIQELRDADEEDPREYKASQFDLNFVALQGDIGCVVNGAGLAMATMDMIQKMGGSPANFLDVGGSATEERVKAAFDILFSDPGVRTVMVNIFGGIMRCDVIARGIVNAAREMERRLPVVVRLEGTNMEEGKKILKESGLAIITADTMIDAAQKSMENSRRMRI